MIDARQFLNPLGDSLLHQLLEDLTTFEVRFDTIDDCLLYLFIGMEGGLVIVVERNGEVDVLRASEPGQLDESEICWESGPNGHGRVFSAWKEVIKIPSQEGWVLARAYPYPTPELREAIKQDLRQLAVLQHDNLAAYLGFYECQEERTLYHLEPKYRMPLSPLVKRPRCWIFLPV